MTALNQPQYQDADAARQWLESIRWPNGPICPHCGSVSEDHYALKGKGGEKGKAHRPGLYMCKDCREQFTVTVGTVFERSKIKLNVWLQAMFLLCSSKKGMSSHQLHRTLGVTYKTAWFMTHRIREAMHNPNGGLLGGGGKIVEADETYYGTIPGMQRVGKSGGATHKHKIVSLVSRKGETRSFHVANVDGENVRAVLDANVAKDTHLMTDGAGLYRPIGKEYLLHESTNHFQKEYAKPSVVEGRTVHSNTVESYFGLLKRGLNGTYHHVSEAHLQRYVNEFDFRFTNRIANGVDDSQRTINALRQIGGKRLTYRRINAGQ